MEGVWRIHRPHLARTRWREVAIFSPAPVTLPRQETRKERVAWGKKFVEKENIQRVSFLFLYRTKETKKQKKMPNKQQTTNNKQQTTNLTWRAVVVAVSSEWRSIQVASDAMVSAIVRTRSGCRNELGSDAMRTNISAIIDED